MITTVRNSTVEWLAVDRLVASSNLVAQITFKMVLCTMSCQRSILSY